MHTFKLKILTPLKTIFDGEVSSVTIPTQAGVISVLKKHTPMISSISIGEIVLSTENEKKNFLVQGGVVDIKETGEVVILADLEFEGAENQNLDAEIERAKEVMKLNKDDIDFAELESELERNLFLKRFQKR